MVDAETPRIPSTAKTVGRFARWYRAAVFSAKTVGSTWEIHRAKSPTTSRNRCNTDPESLDTLPTITEEVLADFAAVAALHAAINRESDLASIKLAAAAAIAEIERTVAKVAQERGK